MAYSEPLKLGMAHGSDMCPTFSVTPHCSLLFQTLPEETLPGTLRTVSGSALSKMFATDRRRLALKLLKYGWSNLMCPLGIKYTSDDEDMIRKTKEGEISHYYVFYLDYMLK